MPDADAIDILLVDDEPRNLDALEAILDEPELPRCCAPTDADRALRLLLEQRRRGDRARHQDAAA